MFTSFHDYLPPASRVVGSSYPSCHPAGGSSATGLSTSKMRPRAGTTDSATLKPSGIATATAGVGNRAAGAGAGALVAGAAIIVAVAAIVIGSPVCW